MSDIFTITMAVQIATRSAEFSLITGQDAGISPALIDAVRLAVIEEEALDVLLKTDALGYVPKPDPLPKVESQAEDTVYIPLDPDQCEKCGRKGEHMCPFHLTKQ